MAKLLILSLLFVLIAHQASAKDDTIVEKAIGQEVVEAVLTKILDSQIFTDDYDFLKRLALVETSFGNNATEFSRGGGIWQLTESNYLRSRNGSLLPFHEGIQNNFTINWNDTTWNDLWKPLHSGLAVRLFIETLPQEIPQTLKEQANFWQKYFGRDGERNQTFIDLVTEWEEENPCKGKMDLLVVLDASGSITGPSFTLALEFVAHLFSSYSLEMVRQGFITFSNNPKTIFPIENNYTAAQINTTVLNTHYTEGGTYTNDAIRAAINLFARTPERAGIPKIMTLFTDGKSNTGVSNAALAKAANITSFAIGIANYLRPELELIANGEKDHVFTLDDFNALTEFFFRLNSATCTIPQEPSLNETLDDSLEKMEKRYYELQIPQEGLTIFVNTTVGSVSGFYSFIYTTPSAVLNDGIIDRVKGTFISRTNNGGLFDQNNGTSVFITVQGNEDQNKYEIRADSGDTTLPDPILPPTTPRPNHSVITSRPIGIFVGIMTILSCYL